MRSLRTCDASVRPPLRQAESADRVRLDAIAETRDQRSANRDRRLHFGKRERRGMTLLVVPHLGDPECLRVRRVLSYYVRKTSWHRGGPVQESPGEFVTFSCNSVHLADQAVHECSCAVAFAPGQPCLRITR